MSSKRKKCKEHEGLTVSFATENCPVCWKDEQIRRLDLVRRFYIAWIKWALDYIGLSDYEGIDRLERESRMDKISSEISNPDTSVERMVQLLEEYGAQRKSSSWK